MPPKFAVTIGVAGIQMCQLQRKQAHANALAAEAKYRSATEATAAAEDAFALSTAKYENGKSSVTEYNEARTRLAKARSDKAQAACEYLFQSRLLDFYRGGALEL